MTTLDEFRTAQADINRARATMQEALARRNATVRALGRAGLTVPEIDHELGGALSRSMIRWILEHI